MTKRKAKSTPRRKATRPPNDKALINHCVIYAQSIAAGNAGYAADPDGSCKYAAALDDRHRKRAESALARITNTTPATAAGLQAKARIAPLMLGDKFRLVKIEEQNFLTTFAGEVKAFLEPIIHGPASAAGAAEGKVAS
jgi:hypothetical protein